MRRTLLWIAVVFLSSISAVLGLCSNSIMEMGEACDGSDLDGLSCSSLAGYASGTLSCRPDCSGYDATLCVPGNTVYAAGCSQQQVQQAVDDANPGDTVAVPAGSCGWSSTGNSPSVQIAKNLVLKGTGIGQTIILDETGTLSSQDPLRVTGSVMVSGFTFTRNAATKDSEAFIKTNGAGWRIADNMLQIVSGDMRGIKASGTGVIHNNTFVNTAQGVSVFGTGPASWSEPASLGTGNAAYVEDNYFDYSADQNDGALDAYGGARYVFRHNTVIGTSVGHHGLDSGGYHSTHTHEVYGNFFENPRSTAYFTVFGSRGGTGVVFDNFVSSDAGSYNSFGMMRNYRSCDDCTVCDSWGICDGSNTLDGNQPGKEGYPCMEQIGRTTGMLLPVQAWNNSFKGQPGKLKAQNLCDRMTALHVLEGRDFYNDAVQFSGGAYSAAYTDDDGESRSWTYIPYPYPHPLRAESLQTCNQLGGYCCTSGQGCQGSITDSSDCSCCIGTCAQSQCGNGACDYGETCSACPGDCAALHSADNKPCDGCLKTAELLDYINIWKTASTPLGELMQAIALWKSGC